MKLLQTNLFLYAVIHWVFFVGALGGKLTQKWKLIQSKQQLTGTLSEN